MAEGWIKLHRSIRKNWIWEDAEKLKWWLDILLQANHQERKILIGNELILVERGSFYTSIIKLSERWKVNRKTVRKFLKLLEQDNMISIKISEKGTTIKVSNYNDFQGVSDKQRDNTVPNGMDNSVDNTEDNTVPNSMDNGVDTNKNDKEYIKNYEEGEEWGEGEETPSSPPLSYSFPTQYHKSIFSEVSEVTYKTWFMNTRIVEEGDLLGIEVENDFTKDVIVKRHLDTLKMIFNKEIIVEVKEE